MVIIYFKTGYKNKESAINVGYYFIPPGYEKFQKPDSLAR
jgi:hypothetical protein